MKKRNEIQWLRALAIFAVLAFHIWPKKFPFGYLGVDIFFVISGYLMTSILAKSIDQSILTFYSRRIKRIFPLCLLVIAVSLLIGYFTLLPSHYAFLQIEAIWASLFVNNFAPMFSEGEYFELVSGFQFFLHTWSLGVEVQFYLIAPFLIRFLLTRSHRLIWIAVIGVLSAAMQLIIPSQAISFGLVFCRIWQFMIGTAACCFTLTQSSEYALLHQKNMEALSMIKKITKAVTILLVVLCFFPVFLITPSVIPPLFRFLATTFTGLFIALNDLQPLQLPTVLNNILVYVGDASYAIYLVHWPLIIFFKYFAILDKYGAWFTLWCILTFSIIVHEWFEKPMGRQAGNMNFIFGSVCYGLIIYLVVFASGQSGNFKLNDPVKLNEEEAASCLKFYYPNCTLDPLIEAHLTVRPKRNYLDQYCSFKFPNNHSSKTIMVLGNSFVYFQIRGIYDAIQQAKTKFNKIFVVTHPGCNLLTGELNKRINYWNCQNFDGSHDKLLEAVNPEVIILTSRLNNNKDLQMFPKGDYNSDKGYNILLRGIQHLASYTKKLIIIQSSPRFLTSDYKNPLSAANLLMNNKSISQFFLTKNEYNETENPSWYRVVEASKHCHNCVLIPTEKLFCNDQVCPMIDPVTKLGRYCDIYHITPTESLKLVPDLVEAINKVLE